MATYYVDATSGSDSANGTSDSTPWKTISKVNAASFSAGDSILFKKGETWREQLDFPSSGSAENPITFGSYGIGNKPKIYGSLVPSSWTQEDITSSISKVQGPVSNNSSAGDYTTVTANFGATPTSGNLLIALGRGYQTTISSASISGWTLAVSAICGSSGAVGIWHKISAGNETGATLTWTGASSAISLSITEWTPFTSSPLDKTAYTDNTGGTTSRSTGTTATTTVDNELLVAAVGWGGPVTNLSWSNSFTGQFESLSAYAYATKIISATGGQETTASWTTSRVNGACIATFKGNLSVSKTLFYASQDSDPLYIYFIGTDNVIHTGTKKINKR